MASNVRCVLVVIHGIGNQQPDWSSSFDALLGARLATLSAAQQARVHRESVYWADLSQLGAAAAAVPAVAPAAAPAGPGSLAYDLAYQQYVLQLSASSGAAAGLGLPSDLSLGKLAKEVLARLTDAGSTVVSRGDQAADVANYVANNGIRLAIQRVLSDQLFAIHAAHPRAAVILGSHSQGTIIAFDVLRLNGKQLPFVNTWVTMGSPLGWYLNFGKWGGEQIGLKVDEWINLFDQSDIVGTTLDGLVNWPLLRPQDEDVDNVGAGLDPHDHYHNPRVVERYFQLIRARVA